MRQSEERQSPVQCDEETLESASPSWAERKLQEDLGRPALAYLRIPYYCIIIGTAREAPTHRSHTANTKLDNLVGPRRHFQHTPADDITRYFDGKVPAHEHFLIQLVWPTIHLLPVTATTLQHVCKSFTAVALVPPAQVFLP